MTRIKICGLTRPEDVRYVNTAKPDWCGFILNFPSSRRNVTPEQARALRAGLDPDIRPVGGFVDRPVEEGAALLNSGVISVAQLHGREDNAYISVLRTLAPGCVVWRAFQLRSQADLAAADASGADLVLLVNTDRGLCGGLNANLIKMVREQAPENAHYITIGRKLNAALAKLNERLEATWSLTDPLSLLELKPVFDFIVQKFKAEEYGRVFVAFSGFVNTMVQKPVFRQLLPIEPEPLMNMAKAGGSSLDGAEAHKQFLLEPSPAALLDTILPLYVFHGLVQIVLEARASEHSARMVAMKGATENAKNIIGGLTLDYNKARQTQITNELLEITTAMRAME